MEERRREQRFRALRCGKIVYDNGRSAIDCLIRNVSDGGACLQVNATAGLPIAFELAIDGEEKGRTCDVIWMSESRVGIEFRDRKALPGISRPMPDTSIVPRDDASTRSD